MQLTCAILAGGVSSRMGMDKAQLRVLGPPMLERTARIPLSFNLPTMVVGRDRPSDWPLDNVAFLRDEIPFQGPLGGLVTALRHTKADVLALSCDMPLLSTEALAWLISVHKPASALAVTRAGQIEPLFSLYPANALALAEQQLASGRRSLHALLRGCLNTRELEIPPHLAGAIRNANTPDEWRELTES